MYQHDGAHRRTTVEGGGDKAYGTVVGVDGRDNVGAAPCQLPERDVEGRCDVDSRLRRFHEAVIAADMAETTRLTQTVDAWWPEIAGFLQTRITNAGAEGTNRLIENAARTAFGFRNLDNQCRWVRFHCTRRARRIPSAEAPCPLKFDEVCHEMRRLR